MHKLCGPLLCAQGYWQESVFLAMPSPTHTSAAQLWRAVLNSRCSTIVALSQPGEVRDYYTSITEAN